MLRSNRNGSGGIHSSLFPRSSIQNHVALAMADPEEGSLTVTTLALGLPLNGASSHSHCYQSQSSGSSHSNSAGDKGGLFSVQQQQPTRRKKTAARPVTVVTRTTLSRSLSAGVGVILLGKLFFLLVGKLSINNSILGHRQHRRAVESATESTPSWDVAIVGAGPSGLTAALFAARAGLAVLVLGSSSTGQLAETSSLDNFPSFVGGAADAGVGKDAGAGAGGGAAWLTVTQRQAAAAGVHFAQAGLRVAQIVRQNDSDNENDLFYLQLESNRHHHLPDIPSRSIVIATGSTARRLNLPLEPQLWGKQVHSCAICDGFIYSNKSVIVVGGGDAAIDAALLLARHAASVTLVHRRSEFRASNQRNVLLLHQNERIRILTPYTVQEYVLSPAPANSDTHQQLASVRVQKLEDHPLKTTEIIRCDGVFVMIGSTPNTKFLAAEPNQPNDSNVVHVDLNTDGLIVVAFNHKDNNAGSALTSATTISSVPGIFAAGEVTDNVYKQAITAAAAGAQAAIDAERWLREHYSDNSVADVSVGARIQRILPDNIPLQVTEATKATAVANTKQLPTVQSARDHLNDDSDSCDLVSEACITALVRKHPVVVFSKPYCPFCKKALEALSLEGVAEEPFLKVVNLLGQGMTATQSRAIQSTLGRMTGGRVTVPNVFVGGTSIGGGDETYALHKQGQLRTLLREARAYPPPTECNLAEVECVQATIETYPVVVFSKNYCPHCKKAIELFDAEGVKRVNLHVVDLMQYENYSDIQDTLAKLTNRRTVPNIFVGSRNLGGTTEVEGMQLNGKLRGYLERAGALESA